MQTQMQDKGRRASVLLLALSYAGFISLGLPDTVLGAAWPAMRSELGLPLDAAGGILLVTTAGVVVSSIATGWLRARIGAGSVLWGSTALAAVALLVNGLAPHWSLLLLAAACAGLGGGAIDATLNDHVARHHSARHMNWLHACWGVGAAIAPSVVALALARGTPSAWRTAYLALGGIEALLALAFVATRSLWQAQSAAADSSNVLQPSAASSRRAMRASVVMFYCYGGLEAGTGLWTSSLLTTQRAFSLAAAGAAVGLYWGALCVGRFIIGAYADRLGPPRVLRVAAAAALVSSAAFATPGTPTWIAITALVALGMSLAPIYPLTMHDTPRRFPGPQGARLVGLQVASTALGMASIPWLLGALAQRTSLAYLPAMVTVLAAAVAALERVRTARVDD